MCLARVCVIKVITGATKREQFLLFSLSASSAHHIPSLLSQQGDCRWRTIWERWLLWRS